MRKMVSKTVIDAFEAMPDRAKALAISFLSESQPEIKFALMDLSECESPIEEILRVALGIMLSIPWDDKDEGIEVCIMPQCELECNGHHHRVDFYISGVNFETEKEVTFVVECDGHEYHNATKEQVARDNKRDYDIKMAGFEVLHFSGSQIYNKPFECANDIINYIIEKVNPKEDDE